MLSRQLLVCYLTLPVMILKLWRGVFDWWSWLMVCGLYTPGKTFFCPCERHLANQSFIWMKCARVSCIVFISFYILQALHDIDKSQLIIYAHNASSQCHLSYVRGEAYPGTKKPPLVAYDVQVFTQIMDMLFLSSHLSINQISAKCYTYEMSCWADLLFLLQDLKICNRMVIF